MEKDIAAESLHIKQELSFRNTPFFNYISFFSAKKCLLVLYEKLRAREDHTFEAAFTLGIKSRDHSIGIFIRKGYNRIHTYQTKHY